LVASLSSAWALRLTSVTRSVFDSSIVVHGLKVTHLWAWPYVTIHHLAEIAADALPAASGLTAWAVTALFDGIIGVILGMALVPLVTKVIMPVWNSVQKK
jgi:predicted DNA repair protein MutK